MQKPQVWSLGGEDPLEMEMATHSNILAWEIPWTEQPGGLQSMEFWRVRHNLAMKQQPQPLKWGFKNMIPETSVEGVEEYDRKGQKVNETSYHYYQTTIKLVTTVAISVQRNSVEYSLELLQLKDKGLGYLVIKSLSVMLEGCFGDISSIILACSVLSLRAFCSINTHTHTHTHTYPHIHTYIPQAKQPWEYRSDCQRNTDKTHGTSVSPSVHFSTQFLQELLLSLDFFQKLHSLMYWFIV